ncbi:NAD-dependent epimerase/dehydratase family protein [Solicola sp. PLA-1-18]|uniref:NAD-dependent epimerase/dehydratase family protein n=1 Tax=Solicola sp. PLA-1-18 TaxID=3380532 RepID=UPI003B7F1A34
MKIVVTGASGNVGTALLRHLASAPEQHEVVGVSRRRPPEVAPYAGVAWVEADLAEPEAAGALTRAMAGADAVVHLAWGFQPSHDLEYLNRLGLQGTASVLEAAIATGVGHVVHMSSLGAYSPRVDDARVDESWPTEGVPGSTYSMQKAAAETLLDGYEDRSGLTIARLRPGLVMQAAAASALLRYGVPSWLPASVLRHVPVLPVDRGLRIQVIHADDLADAIVRVLDQRASGAFNLAAEPSVGRDDVAGVLSATPVHVPRQVLRALVDVSWRLRVQALNPGWIDLAFGVPLMDTGRARRELGWAPFRSSTDTLAETIDAMSHERGGDSPVLRPRRFVEQVASALRSGTVATRHRP